MKGYWIKSEKPGRPVYLQLPIEKEFVSDLYPLIKEKFSKDLSKGDSFGLHSSKYATPFEPQFPLSELDNVERESPIFLQKLRSDREFSNVNLYYKFNDQRMNFEKKFDLRIGALDSCKNNVSIAAVS